MLPLGRRGERDVGQRSQGLRTRIVYDTNTIISAVLTPRDIPASLVESTSGKPPNEKC